MLAFCFKTSLPANCQTRTPVTQKFYNIAALFLNYLAILEAAIFKGTKKENEMQG